MSKFRKKPVVIEAVQLRWDTWQEMCEHANVGKLTDGRPEGFWPDGEGVGRIGMNIPTLEGLMTAVENDWIIKGVKGELYPCKPDIFEKTYEPESAKPPASEGVREALETVVQKWQDVLDGIREIDIKTIGHVRREDAIKWHLKDGIKRVIYDVNKALAALPELEKRSCYFCDKIGSANENCSYCNGHGEVWVRKEGV